MTYLEIKKFFLDNVQEIKNNYIKWHRNDCIDFLEEEGLHNFIGNYVEPYFVDLLQSKNIEILKCFFDVVEKTLVEAERSTVDGVYLDKEYYIEAIEQSLFEGLDVGENGKTILESCQNHPQISKIMYTLQEKRRLGQL